MGKPKVAVLSGFGINCETETITAFEMAGAVLNVMELDGMGWDGTGWGWGWDGMGMG